MTEASEDGNYLVRVRAQVMIRDDSTGGWVPMGGGGLSNVSVRKRTIPCELGQCKHEYLIFGKRISDQSVVLSCIIKKDFEYNKVMPTFHHWKTGEKKFGLTFQTAADARAFDKGLRTAVNELLDGITDQPLIHNKVTGDVGDDDVFMTLNLPVERGDSHSSSDSSTRGVKNSITPQEPGAQTLLAGRAKLGSEHDSSSSHTENFSYLQLATVHEFMYPNVEGSKISQHDSSSSLKKRTLEAVPSPVGKPEKKDDQKIDQLCRYCQKVFVEEENKKGACPYAPDCMKAAMNEVACLRCARCMMYHCMADAEGDFGQNPCECDVDDSCGARWLGLAMLSLVVPCLWLYPPLRACHWCGVRIGLCGGRHRPAS